MTAESSGIERIAGVTGALLYRNNWAQLRSKRILASIAPEAIGGIGYNYDVENVLRQTTSVLQQALRLRGQRVALSDVAGGLLEAAEVFESLATLHEAGNDLTSRFIAATLYELAGYSANAQCMVKELDVPNVPTVITRGTTATLFNRWVILALRRQFLRLRIDTAEVLAAFADREERFVADLEANEASVADASELPLSVLLAEAFEALAEYGLRGGPGAGRAVDWFDHLARHFVTLGDASGTLRARLMMGITQGFETTSMWSVLSGNIDSDRIWRRYATLAARGRAERPIDGKGTVEIWPSQKKALEASLIGAERRSLAIRMPTSAGKTRIAELAILDELTREGGGCAIYVAPFNALASEVEASFSATLADLGFRVSSVVGEFDPDDLEAELLSSADLLIVTPEKLSLMLRAQPDFFSSVGLLVLDEGHLIDAGARGVRYEILVTKLRARMPSAGRILFLSAVINEENVADFAEWLCGDRTAVAHSEWRPGRLLYGIYNIATGRIDYPLEGAVAGANAPFVLRAVQPSTYTDYTKKLRREKQVQFPGTEKGEQAAELAIKFAADGPVLVFTTQRGWAESLATNIQRGLLLRNQTAGVQYPDVFGAVKLATEGPTSLAVAEQWLGPDSSIPGLIRDGIGVHHGGLPDPLLRAIETDFRSGRLPVVVATGTLAQGVNLPVKTLVVHTLHQHVDPDDPDDDRDAAVSLRDFRNIAGRAGRAGAETEGQVIVVAANNYQATEITQRLRAEVEPIRGRLFELLRDLSQQRISSERFRSILDSDLISLMVEESVGTTAEQAFSELLDGAFVKIQARHAGLPLEPLEAAANDAIHKIREEVADGELRRIFALTGLDTASCLQIAEHITVHREEVERAFTSSDVAISESLALMRGVLGEIQPLLARYEFAGDMDELLTDWLNQLPMREIIDRHLSADADEKKFHRFIADYFGYYLPWGISSYSRIATHLLELDPDDLSENLRWLPSMVRYGVSTPRATWGMTLGCPTRGLSGRMAMGFVQRHGPSSYREFLDWFAGLTEEDFILGLNATSEEAAVLVRRARALVPAGRTVTALLRETPTEFISEVAGLQYEGRGDSLTPDLVGIPLRLVRDYPNRYDPNAIQVVHAGDQLGYLPRSLARILAPEIDSGEAFDAVVTDVGFDPPALSLTIRRHKQDVQGAT